MAYRFDNQFGLFIHWGLYAQFGIHEQAFANRPIAREQYESTMHTFHPTAFDPDAIVRLAKEVGMKYICFTAKHHDGFCMWDTKQTDYNIMHTPYGKDVLKMLADACAHHGLRLSLYYSLPDWHCPFAYNPNSSHQWQAVNKAQSDLPRYIAFVKAQITELLTGYGDIYTLFWDIPPKVEDPSVNELVRKLQPNIRINDRGFSKGDFSSPEREFTEELSGATQYYTRMTEACNAVGEQSWGWRDAEDYYSKRYLTGAIDRVMAMGGNYLLNVGPRADGSIAPIQAEKLRAVGDWYNRMGGCLERTEPDGFDYGAASMLTNPCIVNRKNGKSYFHFYAGIRSSAVSLAEFPNAPQAVRLVNTDTPLPFKIETLPTVRNGETGIAEQPLLHITGIPVDELSDEPIVLAITW